MRKTVKAESFTDASSTISDLRMIKGEEVKFICEAPRIAVESLELLIEHIKPGSTEVELGSKIVGKALSLGATVDIPLIMASGRNFIHPHVRASRKKLRINAPIIIDFCPNMKATTPT